MTERGHDHTEEDCLLDNNIVGDDDDSDVDKRQNSDDENQNNSFDSAEENLFDKFRVAKMTKKQKEAEQKKVSVQAKVKKLKQIQLQKDAVSAKKKIDDAKKKKDVTSEYEQEVHHQSPQSSSTNCHTPQIAHILQMAHEQIDQYRQLNIHIDTPLPSQSLFIVKVYLLHNYYNLYYSYFYLW